MAAEAFIEHNQGRTLGLEGEWLGDFTDRTIEMMGDAHPQVVAEKDRIDRWVRAEEESFGRTLDRGTALLEQIVDQALADKNSWISAGDAFKLHDSFYPGFQPIRTAGISRLIFFCCR